MKTWSRGLWALAVLVPHTVSVSCDSATDEGTTLSLSDAAGGGCAGPDSLEAPIALGARLAVQVRDRDVTPPIEQAESSDPVVLLVESAANPVLVRAASPGTATLEVRDSAQSTGSASLTVAEVASIEPRLDELLVFNLDIGLGSPFTATAT
ncbi:MAG: hypothetical protein QF464_20650, partial [Myxococcota bacterium]|nr:hypothetical protein [Myxococcota bacterium]